MIIYVYAIADAPVPLHDLRGVDDEPLRVVSSPDGVIHAVVGEIEKENVPAPNPVDSASGRSLLRAQDALVRELAARADALLPSRFGSRFPDDSSLLQALDDLAPRLTRALTLVRGCEQMTIRLFSDAPTAPALTPAEHEHQHQDQRQDQRKAQHQDQQQHESQDEDRERIGPGTSYLRQRAAISRQRMTLVELLRAPVADMLRSERVEGDQSKIGTIHHLIPRGSSDAYRTRIGEAAASPGFTSGGVRARISGPSPAYAFTEGHVA
jgi:hypothetical protein